MHLALSSPILPLIALPLSLAKTIPIGVGDGGLVFNPSSVTAAVGDLLQFHFYPKNHSVVQGTLSSPCQPLAGGAYSGFYPVAADEGNKVFDVTVTNTDTLYFYCSQEEHCQHGMAMVVNPPSTGPSLAAYKAASVNATTIFPSAIAGGVFASAPGNSSSSTSGTNSTGVSSTPTGGSTGSTGSTPSPSPFTGGAAQVSLSGVLGLMGASGMVLAAMM